jgi:hypothetical protein
LTEFTRYWTENTAAAELTGVRNEYARIVVKTDVAAVSTANLFLYANNDSTAYRTVLDIARRDYTLYGYYNRITERSIALLCSAKYADAQSLFGSRVVGYYEP